MPDNKTGPKEKFLAALAEAYKADHSPHAKEVLDAMRKNVSDKTTIEDVSEIFHGIVVKDIAKSQALFQTASADEKVASETKKRANASYVESEQRHNNGENVKAFGSQIKCMLEIALHNDQEKTAQFDELRAELAQQQVKNDDSELSNLIVLSRKAGFKHKHNGR